MDPNTALATLRTMVQLVNDEQAADPAALLRDLADQFQALDEWLTKGGFKPAAWETPTDRVWVARRVHLWGYDSEGGLEEYLVDVLVNDWSDGTREVALQEHDKTKWGLPAPLVEETG